MASFTISGQLVDAQLEKIFPATLTIQDGKIISIEPINGPDVAALPFLLPGFIDSHVHVESSMLVPSEFAKLAVVHGTVATISDPHEIANVCGIEGVQYMIENGKTVPFKFHFGAPSCVPATVFETAGARLDAVEVKQLLDNPDIFYLSEMMNFPGVLHGDAEVLTKIKAAHAVGKPVDGHAPGLRGEEAKKYIDAGISTDHECFTAEEALDKLGYGMKILIREGSAAKNFEALIGLLNDHPNEMMFCSDDKHPDSLVAGHINQLCARAVHKGCSIFSIIKAACINPVLHYQMKVGLLKLGDPADFIVVNDLINFEVRQTYIDGVLVAENGRSFIVTQQATVINNFSRVPLEEASLRVEAARSDLPVIKALDGQLITLKENLSPMNRQGWLESDVEQDVLKIVVVNRYTNAPVAKAFIHGVGLQVGALASSVAHDSHNIVAVGVDDESLCKAINMIIAHKGGVSCVQGDSELVLPLPVAGLMSNEDGYHVAAQYSLLDKAAKEAGSGLAAPFMTLSFMALLVIPHLKLSDLGLFDGDDFKLISTP